MTIGEYIHRNVPKYFPNMYLEGYTPEQIRFAVIRDMMEEHEPIEYQVKFESEVKVK